MKKVEFLGAQNAPFERPQRPNAILCDMNFYAHHIFRTLRIFYIKMSTSEGRKGGEVLHIVSSETPNLLIKQLFTVIQEANF